MAGNPGIDSLDWVHTEMVRSFAEFRKNHWLSAVVKPEVDGSRAVHLAHIHDRKIIHA
jgi:hypothetical protein